MSSEMRELIRKEVEQWVGITRNRDIERSALVWMEGYDAALTYCAERISALLARTEAGADGAAEPFGYFDSQGLSHAGNSTNFRWLLEQHREGKPNWGNLKLLYTHPQDASGDAERYRWLRTALYSQNLDIGEAELSLRCYGAAPTLEQFDASIDAAMQAKEAK